MSRLVIATLVLTMAQGATAAEPPSVPQQQKMILWSVTIGEKLSLPACRTGKYDAVIEPVGDEPACIHGQFIYNLLHDNQPQYTHDYHATTVEVENDVVGKLFISTILDADCVSIVPSLTKKFGKPVRIPKTMQNGFGATWEGDNYIWETANGSTVTVFVHTIKPDSCTLSAESAEHQGKNKRPAMREP